ncbi:MAG: Ty1/Copia family ribonuclease HI [bacterium]
MLNGGAVSWRSGLQQCVTVSTAEAEYVAGSTAAREALALRVLMYDLGFAQGAMTIKFDNKAAIHIADGSTSTRSKHIDIHHHFIRQRIRMGQLKAVHIPTAQMAADIFTKPLPASKHNACVSMLGMK